MQGLKPREYLVAVSPAAILLTVAAAAASQAMLLRCGTGLRRRGTGAQPLKLAGATACLGIRLAIGDCNGDRILVSGR